jgi:hypothetical protein
MDTDFAQTMNVCHHTPIQLNWMNLRRHEGDGHLFIFNLINEVEGDGHTVVGFLVLLVGDRLTAHT